MLARLKRTFKQLRALLPSRLPVGVTEFEAWADSFSDTYTLATQDRDSIHYILATEILRLNPTDYSRKAKFHFYLVIQTAAAKQIAGNAFQQIKLRQKELQDKAAKEAANETQTG